MPDLLHSLLEQDIGHLRIFAGLWGIELDSNDEGSAREELSASLLDPELVAELMDSLAPPARAAILALTNSGGRIPWAAFVREFGDVREMGAGKRDRERPHLKPSSTSEYLFYRALIARAFFDTDKGPQEFAYIPDDLFELINHEGHEEHKGKGKENSVVNSEPLGRGATPGEKNHLLPANDRILDDATTLLAALRIGRGISAEPKLFSLLHATGLISPSPRGRGKGEGEINAEKVKAFLEASRANALQMLIEAWQKSEAFNELRLMPNIICEGEWKNQPQVTREFLLNLLEAIPDDKWWSLIPFIRDVKQKFPDFQRPAGDYDSWFIKRASDGQYLRGFGYWDEVDGALIRFFITDILYWLGMVELASAEEGGAPMAFRVFDIRDSNIRLSNIENAKIKVSSQGKIIVPKYVPRAVRYQLARFCEWDEDGGRVVAPYAPHIETKPDEYRYNITPRSFTKAKEQGLKVEQLLPLLSNHAAAGIPPVLVMALKRGEVNGTEARAETQVILKVSRPEVLEELRKSKAARFLGEPLGPTSIVIKAGAQSKVMDALAEMGLLAEGNTNGQTF